MGLFTGEEAELTIHPAEPNTGIFFRRADLKGTPLIKAVLQNVVKTPRCTILGNEKATIHTVEHLLSALHAFGIDNALLDLSGPEVPIMDGSAKAFVDLIDDAGIFQQDEDKLIARLRSPISWSNDQVHIVAIPSDEFQVSYTLHYPQSKALQSQYCSFAIEEDVYRKEIAPCRTFCLYEEIAPFIEKGLIKGGGMNNAVVIKDEKILNSDGIRFPDEMARHKILDLIGDMSLIPYAFTAHIIALRSGHTANIAFAKELMNYFIMENA